MKLSIKLVAIAAAALTVPVAAGVALAGTPSADGTITACVKTDGVPRIIDKEAGATCAAGEQEISWSAGWRVRGTYDRTLTYQVGDVAILPKQCGPSPTAVGPVTIVKVGPGSESASSWAGCPLTNQSWRALTRAVRVDYLPGPVSLRVKVTDDNTRYVPGQKYPVTAWNYPGIVWLQIPHTDVTSCSATATAFSESPVVVTRGTSLYAGWIYFNLRNLDKSYADVPLDITLDCPLPVSSY